MKSIYDNNISFYRPSAVRRVSNIRQAASPLLLSSLPYLLEWHHLRLSYHLGCHKKSAVLGLEDIALTQFESLIYVESALAGQNKFLSLEPFQNVRR
jgi:hypothetical protein